MGSTCQMHISCKEQNRGWASRTPSQGDILRGGEEGRAEVSLEVFSKEGSGGGVASALSYHL